MAGHAVAGPVVCEKLALEPRHVHADRAFRLARTTFETEVEHVVDAVIAKSCFADPSRHREAQDVRAASG